MKLIKHIIPVYIGNSKWFLVNSLNGTVDKVGLQIYEIIQKWQGDEEIIAENEIEVTLYESLKARGYLTNSFDEEMQQKSQMVSRLREIHNKKNATCNHMTFIMTYNCNFRCPYCFEGENTLKKEVMSPAQIDAALDMAGEHLKSVGLFGGEPLLPSNRTSLEYLISRTKDKTFNITTNGYYLEEFFDLLSPLNFSSIMVTLDGDEDTHNSRRFLANGKPTFSKIMKGIGKYLENDIPICIRMNLDKSNINEATKLRKSLIDRFYNHKDLLTFELGTLFGASNQEKTNIVAKIFNEDKVFSPEERQKRNRLVCCNSSIVNFISVGAKPKPAYSFCYANSSTFLVDPYGDIYTCLISLGTQDLAVGKYLPKIEFKENSILTRNIETIPECKECIYSMLCGGGCPLSLGSYENVWRPECFSIKNQMHNLLPRLYAINEEAEGVASL